MKTLIPVFAMAMLSLTVPSDAGQRHGGSGHGGGSHGGGGAFRGSSSHGGVRGPSRGFEQARSAPAYRGSVGARPGAVVRGGVGIAPRVAAPRVIVGGGSRFYGGGFYGGGFYRPYYTFRPRFSVGFGFWAGYPVPYPYDYAYPYSYGYPYSYAAPYPVDPNAYGYAAPAYGAPAPSTAYPPTGYPPTGYPSAPYPPATGPSADPQTTQPQGQSAATGGISFEVTPNTASVFVDGTYVGTAGTFGATMRPLGLTAGHHHIEIRADGYRTMTIEADVTPGQVVPYQGALQRK